jgi:hypothetical protein
MRPDDPHSPPAGQRAAASDAVRAREDGFALLRRANRWLVGLAVLLAGALTGLTAHAFHAKPASAATTSAPAQNTGGAENSGNTGAGNTAAGNTAAGNTGAGNTGAGNTGAGNTASAVPPPSSAPAPGPVAPVVSGGS